MGTDSRRPCADLTQQKGGEPAHLPIRSSSNKEYIDNPCRIVILTRMANHSPPSLDETFFALGDPTRRGMLVRLSHGETSISEFASDFGVSLPTIHKHLHVLERAGFIDHEKRGRVRHVRLAQSPARKCAGGRRVNLAPLNAVKDWMAHLESQWDKHLLQLKHQVESDL